jgi:hypothetical protein
MKIRVSDLPNAKTKTDKEIKENTAILERLLPLVTAFWDRMS